jgi:hypothetical protein
VLQFTHLFQARLGEAACVAVATGEDGASPGTSLASFEGLARAVVIHRAATLEELQVGSFSAMSRQSGLGLSLQ